MSLGGTMLWTLDFDDYSGQFCGQGEFPLANAIKAVFDEYETDSDVSNKTDLFRLNSSIFDKHEFENQVPFVVDKGIENVLINSVIPKNYFSVTKMTTEVTSTTNTTIKTFYIPNIRNLSEFQSLSETDRLNGVMYEIMNVPLVADADNERLGDNLTTTNKTSLLLNKACISSVNIIKHFVCFISILAVGFLLF